MINLDELPCIKKLNLYYGFELFKAVEEDSRIKVFNTVLNTYMAASFSLSAAQDIAMFHKINVKKEIDDAIEYEIHAEINRFKDVYDDIYTTHHIGDKLDALGF